MLKMKEIISDLDAEFSNLEKTDIETSIHPSPKNKSRKVLIHMFIIILITVIVFL